MRISKGHVVVRLLSVLLVLGVLAFLVVSCKEAETPPANGTVTVKLTGAAAQNTITFMFAVFKESADIMVDDPDGVGVTVIAAGEAQATAKDLATGTTDVSLTGGGKYFVAALIDVDNDQDPSTGDYLYQGAVFTMDGNRTEVLNYTSFSIVP